MHPTSLLQPDLKQQRVTLKDVASESGLSIASVSMALRNNSNISTATIQRVRLVARRLGYVPDPALSALAEYRKSRRGPQVRAALALLSDWESPDAWAGKCTARVLMKGAIERAAELGYSLQHIWAPPHEVARRRLEQILQSRGIRGILLAPSNPLGSGLQLDWSHYSVVTIGHAAANNPFDCVEPNSLEAIRTCWSRLTTSGYSRIGLVLDGSAALACPDGIESGFDQVRRHSSDPDSRVPVLRISSATSIETVGTWLREQCPDAIISGHPGLLAMLLALGVSIPKELAYVSLDADVEPSGVSGIAQQSTALGAVAVDQLHRKLIDSVCGSRTFTMACQVTGRWQDGWSLAQPGNAHHAREKILCA